MVHGSIVSSYRQVEMDAASLEKTAFATYSGLCEFNKMLFGPVNAPTTFQRLMEIVLAVLVRNCIDDVLVTGKIGEEHIGNLKKVFDCLCTAKLRFKKCKFASLEVDILYEWMG